MTNWKLEKHAGFDGMAGPVFIVVMDGVGIGAHNEGDAVWQAETPTLDALAVYRWLLDEGYAPGQIAIAGESAGAGLTLSTLVSLRDNREPLPAAAALISGWFDLSPSSASMQTNAPYDYVTARGLRAYARRFANEDQYRNPLASPIYADFTGLPPLMIQVGAAETLLDDSLRLADLAKEAGVRVELEVWNDMIHGWHMFAPFLPDARRAIARVGAFVQSALEFSTLAAE